MADQARDILSGMSNEQVIAYIAKKGDFRKAEMFNSMKW